MTHVDEARFDGERFAVLSDLHGLSQTGLASRLEVSQAFISKIINHERPVPFELVVRAAKEFSLPLKFFSVEPNVFRRKITTFRRASKATMADERRVVSLLQEASRFWSYVSAVSGYRDLSLPEVSSELWDPEDLAIAVRAEHGLKKSDPVPSVTRLLEQRGVAIIRVLDPYSPASRDEGRQHDGASIPTKECHRPVVALVGELPGGVARLTLAHEFAHIAFDRDRATRITSTRSPEERRAFEFAGALLLPRGIVHERISEATTLMHYLPIKAEFGISVSAIIMRSQRLGAISPGRARSLHIQLSSLGWRKQEPIEIMREQPSLLRQASRRVWPVNTISRASHELGIAPDLLLSWLDMSDDDRGGPDAEIVSLASRKRSHA